MQEFVRPKDGWSQLLPGGESTAQAIFPNIFLPQWLYYLHITDKNFFRAAAVIAHERQHLINQERIGVWKWYFKYFMSKKFRLYEELIATEAEMKVHKQRKIMYDFHLHAKSLSGYLYIWMIDFDTALKLLDELWRKTTAE